MIVSLVEDYPNYMIINLDKVRVIKNELHVLQLDLLLASSLKSARELLRSSARELKSTSIGIELKPVAVALANIGGTRDVEPGELELQGHP